LRLKRLASVASGLLLAACISGVSAAAASAAGLTGAGSTLAAPIIAEWGAAWANQTGDTFSYSPVGSGAGYKDISGGLVDFGASDAPLSSYSTPCANCIQIPWGLSAVGVGYHLNGVRGLKLTGPIVAAIYLGQITKWNDPRIRALNKGLHLPNLAITPIHRSDGSGTTYAFANYLSDISSTWKSRVGFSTVVNWPVGVGGNGNAGVVSILGSTNGAVSYNEVTYLIAHQLPAAAIKNAAGRYVFPNLSNIETAASIVKSVPASNEMHIVNPPKRVKSAYPISTFTYAIVPTNAPQGALLQSFISYALGAGQRFGPSLDFAPIPKVVLRAAHRTLSSVS
jgi:phosphate transport system substrate-binding protein